MRKNKKGRPSKIKDIKKKVSYLRDLGMSYTEIGDTLGISKQLARYHYINRDIKKSLDKEM